MPYKILFSDIDGTLLDAQRSLSARTIKVISQLKERLLIIFVSSRMPIQMYYLQEKAGLLGMPLIAYNGALVLGREREVLHSVEISLPLCEQIVALNRECTLGKLHISFYNFDKWYVPQRDIWAVYEERNTCTTPLVETNERVLSLWRPQNKGAHKLMLMGEAPLVEVMWQALQIQMGEQLQLYKAKSTCIEVTLKNVSKLTGIKAFLSHQKNISLSDAIAFGDNYNDKEMLEAVGLGVAVGNARDQVKAVAKAVTEHHEEDGVAQYLAQMFDIEL